MEDVFYCTDIFLGAYFMANGFEYLRAETNNKNKVVFLFDKSNELMQTFERFKHDRDIQILCENYHALKRAIWEHRNPQKA